MEPLGLVTVHVDMTTNADYAGLKAHRSIDTVINFYKTVDQTFPAYRSTPSFCKISGPSIMLQKIL